MHRDRARASRADARPTSEATSTRPTAAVVVSPPVSTPRVTLAAGVPDSGRVSIVLRFALAQVGDRYVWGASGPNTWDCSGLAMAAYAQVGIALPHSTTGMLRRGRPVSRNALVPGDLVFPSTGHVALYLGSGKVVEAANPRAGVRVAPMGAFYTARRLL